MEKEESIKTADLSKMSESEIIELCHNIYKKTFSYELDSLKVNDDGTVTHLHSDRFLDEHPERRDNPEYTEEEERKQGEFIADLAKVTYDVFGHLF